MALHITLPAQIANATSNQFRVMNQPVMLKFLPGSSELATNTKNQFIMALCCTKPND